MKVSASQPFQIIYSLFQHEYLGYVLESFIVHVDAEGRLTFQHQNISAKNAVEFSKGLDETDFELINLMDSMQQDAVVKHFLKKVAKPDEFFSKVFDKTKGNELLQKEIEAYMEKRRAAVLEKLKGKMLFEMGNDGEPTWRRIEVLDKRANVEFHFSRGDASTQYYPTMFYEGKQVDFQFKSGFLICKSPAWMVLSGKLYGFEKNVDGKKLMPFLNKKFVEIPRNVEESYFSNFIAPLIASFENINAKGFEISKEQYDPKPILTLAELQEVAAADLPGLFDAEDKHSKNLTEDGKMVFTLSFKYGKYKFRGDNAGSVNVKMEKQNGSYLFHRIARKPEQEKNYSQTLQRLGLSLKGFKIALPKPQAFAWLNENRIHLLDLGFEVSQPENNDKKYFVGKAVFELEVRETIDWFDIHARIKFGEFEISFKEIRKLILRKKVEFKLPNGEIAVIPESWLNKYSDLFALSETEGDKDKPVLRKHHLNLVKELQEGHLAKVYISDKLKKLQQFSGIMDYPLPQNFQGELRPYQKAGFNWLRFLNDYRLGGCLADDMGLGKTVQALAMLQAEKEKKDVGATLIVMPTSLIYNWEMEAAKFTPELKVLNYTGTQRNKDISRFSRYDIVLTSYGIVRLDEELLSQFYFNYIILDESQVIKNPTSNIAKAVKKLRSKNKLILTGTPLENTTMDLWSQMSFINPGLIGTQSFFKQEFLIPIEKKADESKLKKLNAVIKPFILRRHKSQVATELPDKVEHVQYCTMTKEQQQRYDEVKSHYRNLILEQIDKQGINQAKFAILEGLTKLRQIANHPSMIDMRYTGDSGKMEDVTHMLDNALLEDHKVLIFSQFVKHLDLYRKHLNSRKINYAYLDGSSIDRKEQVEKFQKDPNIKIFLISIKAGGLGLNLTKADYVFILDPWWNPAVEAQAIDRAHRIGQKNRVFTYKFISKETVEEKILLLQKHKLKLSESLITTEEGVVKSLTREDIEQILA
jgi:SNF2 family DNA or RNA helicase